MRALSVCGLILCAVLLRAQTADTQPGVITRNDPEYSNEATRAFVQSTVTLSITVGEDGRAHDIQVAQPSGFGLDEKAVEAMQSWVFRPGTKNGHPVPMPAKVEMNFHLQVRNDTEDHSYQFARLNFTLPEGATRPELVTADCQETPTPRAIRRCAFIFRLVPMACLPISRFSARRTKPGSRKRCAWFAPGAFVPRHSAVSLFRSMEFSNWLTAHRRSPSR